MVDAPSFLLEAAAALLHLPDLFRHPLGFLVELDLAGAGQTVPEGIEAITGTTQQFQAPHQFVPLALEFQHGLMGAGPHAEILRVIGPAQGQEVVQFLLCPSPPPFPVLHHPAGSFRLLQRRFPMGLGFPGPFHPVDQGVRRRGYLPPIAVSEGDIMGNGQRFHLLPEFLDVPLDGGGPAPHPAGFRQGAPGRIDAGEKGGHGVRSERLIQPAFPQPLPPFQKSFPVRLRRALLFCGRICETLFLGPLPPGRFLQPGVGGIPGPQLGPGGLQTGFRRVQRRPIDLSRRVQRRRCLGQRLPGPSRRRFGAGCLLAQR